MTDKLTVRGFVPREIVAEPELAERAPMATLPDGGLVYTIPRTERMLVKHAETHKRLVDRAHLHWQDPGLSDTSCLLSAPTDRDTFMAYLFAWKAPEYIDKFLSLTEVEQAEAVERGLAAIAIEDRQLMQLIANEDESIHATWELTDDSGE